MKLCVFLCFYAQYHHAKYLIFLIMVDQIIQQYSYDAYGNALNFNASQALTNLLYSGEQFNPVSGLQYLRARWYNPQSGRFNRLDPFAGNQLSPLSFHKYAYAHMNPIMGTDPSGLFTIIETMMTVACIGLTVSSGIQTLKSIYSSAQSILSILNAASILREASEWDPVNSLISQHRLVLYAISEFGNIGKDALTALVGAGAGMAAGGIASAAFAKLMSSKGVGGAFALAMAFTRTKSLQVITWDRVTRPYSQIFGHHPLAASAYKNHPFNRTTMQDFSHYRNMAPALGDAFDKFHGPYYDFQREAWREFYWSGRPLTLGAAINVERKAIKRMNLPTEYEDLVLKGLMETWEFHVIHDLNPTYIPWSGQFDRESFF